MDKKYTGDCTLQVYNVDYQGRANIQNYFNLMQEAAMQHSHTRGFGSELLREKNLIWVVTRFEFELFNQARWGDQLTVETWSRGMIGAHAYRDFRITKTTRDGPALLGQASSSWLTLDLHLRKPVILRGEKIDHLSIKDDSVGIAPRKITFDQPICDVGAAIGTLVVKNSDLDINNHVNNTKYIQWVYDSLTQNEVCSLPEKGFAINYLAEAHLNDEIFIFREGSKFQARRRDQKIVFNCEFI